MVHANTFKKVQEINDLSLWQVEHHPEVKGTFEIKKTKKSLNWQDIDGVEFFKKYSDQKIQVLKLISVKDWHADKYLWVPASADQQFSSLEVHGSYVDFSGTKINFIEVHRYTANQTIQILQTTPAHLINLEKPGLELLTYLKSKAEKVSIK
jgi:hypothetical protein